MNRNGTGAIILAPTRELAMQTYGVIKELMVNHIQTHGLIMGGSDRRAEAKRLGKGLLALCIQLNSIKPDFFYLEIRNKSGLMEFCPKVHFCTNTDKNSLF